MRMNEFGKLILIVMVIAKGVFASLPLQLDFGAGPVQSGFQQFQSTDSGVTLYDGIKVTVSAAAAVSWRYREPSTTPQLNGVPNENLYRDFVYKGSTSGYDMTLTIEGLLPNYDYLLTVFSYDYGSNTYYREAEWLVDSKVVLTTGFGSASIPKEEQIPVTETDYSSSGIVRSDAAGKIVMTSRRGSGDLGNGNYAFVNALIVNVPTMAYSPQPADGATMVPLDTTLSWRTGRDPNAPTQLNSSIGKYYLYFTSDEDPNFAEMEPISIPASVPVQETVTYTPTGLDYDEVLHWRVDEGVDLGGGVISGPDDPETIVGFVWSCEMVKSVSVITTQPVFTKINAGETAEFAVQFTSPSPVAATWHKDNQPLTIGGHISVTDTDASSTLTMTHVTTTDIGTYYCVLTNGGGSVQSDTAELSVKRLLAHYEFEQNLQDSAGSNHASVVNGMEYVEGIMGSYAADPNGGNYGLLTVDAYPKAGYGNGLEAFTYSFWVKRGIYANSGSRIFGCFNDSGTGVQVNVSGTGSLGCYIRSEELSSSLNTPAESIHEDQWHHVVFTFDGSRIRAFIDGLAKDELDVAPMDTFLAWQYPMVVFARNNRGVIDEFYPGQADDLRIYNYAMTNEQVAQLYYDVTGQPVCLYKLGFDVSGPEGTPDCAVNLYDFNVFAAEWLGTGFFPVE